jgi:hypothetical protein
LVSAAFNRPSCIKSAGFDICDIQLSVVHDGSDGVDDSDGSYNLSGMCGVVSPGYDMIGGIELEVPILVAIRMNYHGHVSLTA